MSGNRPATRARNLRKVTDYDLGFNWGTVNSVTLGLGITALIVGYVALSRGSRTLAPVLLVLGYCVLIPASLLLRTQKPETGE